MSTVDESQDTPNTYVLIIEFGAEPPRIAVFDSFEDAEGQLDAFTVTVFDPPQNDGLYDDTPLRWRIFECRGKGAELAFNFKPGDVSGWGVEVAASRAEKHAQKAERTDG